jgi:diaminopimelate epimerase
MKFSKYHALGNDYLVLDESDFDRALTVPEIRRICHRHFGIGSDGILWTAVKPEERSYSLRIFNPDGSEAEKSGNGLRIFARFLWDSGLVNDEDISIHLAGGDAHAMVARKGDLVTVHMGKASFESRKIPVSGPPREVLNEEIEAESTKYRFSAVTVGNPHCVIFQPVVSREETIAAGPIIENDSRFPNRTNVQFVNVVTRSRLKIEIWERGVGYTLSSGSSSCAAAAVARKLGLCEERVEVEMPGGKVTVEVDPDFTLRVAGPVVKITQGTISPEVLTQTI